MPKPSFTASEKPAAILDRYGRWLADELGRKWIKTRHCVERRLGEQAQELILQPSRYNQAGVATSVWPRVTIRDGRLAQWRGANLESTVLPQAGSIADLVYTTLLINVVENLVSVELSGLPPDDHWAGRMSADDFFDRLQTEILPVLELFNDPVELPRKLPVAWLRMVNADTVEWLLATTGRDLAGLLVRRHVERPLEPKESWASRFARFDRGWRAAPSRDELRDDVTRSLVALGWLSRVHDLVTPDELRPAEVESSQAQAS